MHTFIPKKDDGHIKKLEGEFQRYLIRNWSSHGPPGFFIAKKGSLITDEFEIVGGVISPIDEKEETVEYFDMDIAVSHHSKKDNSDIYDKFKKTVKMMGQRCIKR